MKKLLLFLAVSVLAFGAFAQNFAWVKTDNTTTYSDSYGLATDKAGNVYNTGFFIGTTDFDPGPGKYNLTSTGRSMFICKLNASGNFVWAKAFAGTSAGGTQGNWLVLDSAANIYATGFFGGTVDFNPGSGTFNLSSVSASSDIFMLKMDSAGNFIWATGIGGSTDDQGRTINVDAKGNVYTSGLFQGTADFNPGTGSYVLTSAGNMDIFVSKLDSSGNFIWAKRMGNTTLDLASSSAVDAAGNIYTTGQFRGTVDFDPGSGTANLTAAGSDDIFVSKLDSGGNFVWAKDIGGTAGEYSQTLKLDAAANVYTVGYFSGQTDFDPGSAVYTLTANSGDIFISKLDSSGSFVWAKALGGASADYGYGLDLDAAGNVYSTGYISGTADFNPGTGTYYLTSNGVQDIFVSKLNSAGNFVSARVIGSVSADYGYAIEVDKDTNLFVTGSYSGVGEFDPGPGTFFDTATGSTDVYVLKLFGLPLLAGAISGPVSVCPGTTAFYSLSPVTGATNYTWSVPAGATLNSGQGTFSISVTFGSSAGSVKVIPSNANSSSDPETLAVSLKAAPVVGFNATPGLIVCAGEMVTLSGTGAPAFSWSGGISNGVAFVADSSRTYIVTGTAANGCTDTSAANLTVHQLPNASAGNDTSICPGDSIQLNASGGLSYNWLVSQGLSNLNISNPYAKPLFSAGYIVEVTGVNGCKDQDTMEITVNPKPVISISPTDPEICKGSVTIISANGAATYKWFPASGLSSSTGSQVTASPGTSTLYKVTGTTTKGCSSSKDFTVIVNPPPVVSVTPASSQFCEGSFVQLTASGAASYHWLPVTGLDSSNTRVVKASPSASTVYKVVGTDTNNCADTATATVNINPSPVVSVTPASSQFCEGSFVQLTASGAASYHWLPVTGLDSSNTRVVKASPSATTVYKVVGTDANNCTDTATATVNFNPKPSPFNITGPITVLPFHLETYSAPNNAGSSYNWFVTGGNKATGGNSSLIQVQWSAGPAGLIKGVEVDSKGCSGDTASLQVSIGNVFAEQIKSDETFKLFPVPVKDVLNVELPAYNFKGTVVSIYNSFGQLVYKTAADSRNIQLDVEGLTPGLFYLQLSNEFYSVCKKFRKIN